MFAHSSIVDCGIGDWSVAGAQTDDMLVGANRFTGNLANWPPENVDSSQVSARPPGRPDGPVFGSARAALGLADTENKIAGVFAEALRKSGKGAPR
jgi:hypothetical protein